jgi:hypothetical protein
VPTAWYSTYTPLSIFQGLFLITIQIGALAHRCRYRDDLKIYGQRLLMFNSSKSRTNVVSAMNPNFSSFQLVMKHASTFALFKDFIAVSRQSIGANAVFPVKIRATFNKLVKRVMYLISMLQRILTIFWRCDRE